MPFIVGNSRLGFPLARYFTSLIPGSPRMKKTPSDHHSNPEILVISSDEENHPYRIRVVPTHDVDDHMLLRPWQRCIATSLGVTAILPAFLTLLYMLVHVNAFLRLHPNNGDLWTLVAVSMIDTLVFGK